jgi:hypothetical protein
MDENDKGLDRVCQIYENLDDEEKVKVIKLAEGLLNCQKAITKTENTDSEEG